MVLFKDSPPAAQGRLHPVPMIKLRVKLEGARRAAKETSAQSRQISEAKSEPYWGKSGTLRPEMGTLGWVILRILETQIPLKL